MPKIFITVCVGYIKQQHKIMGGARGVAGGQLPPCALAPPPGERLDLVI